MLLRKICIAVGYLLSNPPFFFFFIEHDVRPFLTTAHRHDLLFRRADRMDYLVNSFVVPLSSFFSFHLKKKKKNNDKIAMQLRYYDDFQAYDDRLEIVEGCLNAERSPFRGWGRRLVRRPRKTDPISRIPDVDAEISPFVPR